MSEIQADKLQRVRQSARCLVSLQEMHAAVDRLAGELSRDYSERNPVLLTVMNGAVVFAGQLLPRLDFLLEIDYLHATRYNNSTAGSDIVWKAKPETELSGRHVLVLDDILDEGTTLEAIVDYCRGQGAASVATAVLVDKQHDRKARPGLVADYTALWLEDAYLFGAGMDYKGYWRNAPGIYALAEQDL